MPFDKVDKNHKAVFKIGLAINYNSRTEQYHTYFPNGVYMIAFLENPPLKSQKTRSISKLQTKKQLYQNIETSIMNHVISLGGKKIYSTTRITKPNDRREGSTEWIYCNEIDIHEAFVKAKNNYGGTLKLYYLEGKDDKGKYTSINQIARQEEKVKPSFVGEIIYHW